MRSRFRTFYSVFLSLAFIVVMPTAFAQMDRGTGRGTHMGAYDPSSVVTLKGTVQDVQTGMMQQGQGHHKGGMGGTHIVLKTDKETLTVMVGPSQFLDEKNFTLAKGDQIEVTGSKVKYGDSEAIIAREIKKGDKLLTLRDEKGVPAWSMGHQR